MSELKAPETRARVARRAARAATPLIALSMVLGISITADASADSRSGESQTFEGTVLNLVVEDDGDHIDEIGGELPVVTVVEIDGLLYELPGDLTSTLITGDVVDVTVTSDAGLTMEDALMAAEVVAVKQTSEGATEDTTLAEAAVAHSLTVLPIYWSAGPSADTNSLRTLANSTRDYWYSQSGGSLTIPTIDVRNWVQVAAPPSCTTQAMLDLFTAARTAQGVGSPTSTSHVVVFFPQWSACGWSGMASVGGGMVWINGTLVPDVLAHEFGHNLGLGHANTFTCVAGGARTPLTVPLSGCTPIEYRDYADVMGIGMTNKPTGSLNSAFADHLGYVALTDVTNPPSGGVTTELAPLSGASGHRALRMSIPGGQLYVDYRPASGRDTRWSGWAGVQLHVKTTDSRGIPSSYLLNMQPASGDFTTPTTVKPQMLAGMAWQVPGTSQTISVASTGATAVVSVASQLFTDVTPAHPFHKEILWLAGQGITTGYSDGSFRASNPISREAMAAFLYRYAKVTDYGPPTTALFWDVPVGRYFYTQISWLAEKGITTGLGDGSFGALAPITRQAMAAFLFRFAGETGYVPPAVARFADVPVNHPFYREISWLAERGITTGFSDGTFGCTQSVTRQAVAAFLYRLDGVLIK